MNTMDKSKYFDEKGRDYYFDNAKFILIFLVVLAHFISPLKQQHRSLDMLWMVINSLHMPCLIMISGYFAKSYIKSDGTFNIQRPFRLILYYLFAQITVSAFEYFVLKTPGMTLGIFGARSSLWFLQCLIVWMIILPFAVKKDKKVLIPFAFVFAILIGYDKYIGQSFSSSRIIVHFPFFLIGYYFNKEWLIRIKNKFSITAAAVVIIGIGLIVYKFAKYIPKHIITSEYSYFNITNQIPMGYMWMVRLGFYITALTLCFCFMLIVPRRHLIFTKLGSRTLQVYIWHRFIYLAALKYNWMDRFDSRKGIICVFVICAIMTVVLSLKPFELPFILLNKIRFKEKKAIG